MKKHKREIAIASVFILLTVALHFVHYFIFHDKHHLLIYGMGDLAFLPLEVLIITVILHRLLEWRDKKVLDAKMNMLIGGFFSEMGIDTIRLIVQMDKSLEVAKSSLIIKSRDLKKVFSRVLRFSHGYKPDLQLGCDEITAIKQLFITKRAFLSSLLQHPILL